MQTEYFDDELRQRVERAVPADGVIHTLGLSRPNRVLTVESAGVLVETQRSLVKGSGPQLVPAWMIASAWGHLSRHGSLSNQMLMTELSVKRSAFVCALLARFPDVEVASVRPIVLALTSRG